MLIDVSELKKTATYDLVTVGHLAIDIIKSGNITKPKPTIGGPPTYVSVAAAKLGSKVSIISEVGEDFPSKHIRWLQRNNVDLSGLKRIPSASTTQFIIEYKNSERRLQLKTRAPSIKPQDIPKSLKANIIHVAPIANEISHEVITSLRRHAETLSLDPQGFVRSFDKKGNVSLKKWRHLETLASIDICKSAAAEIQAATGIKNLRSAMKQISDCGARIVIATKGLKGSELLFQGRFYTVPACKPKAVVDPTGAGDAYMGAFLAEYIHGKDVLWCASVGSAAASFIVEGLGPERFGEEHEVYERAAGIYEKVTESKSENRLWVAWQKASSAM